MPAATIRDGAAPTRRRARGSQRYGRLNTLTARLLVLLVLVSAIPVASNRPAWWLIWTFLLGLGALAYLLRAQMLMGRQRPLQTNQFTLFFTVALLVPAFALLQSLPLAQLVPVAWQALPSAVAGLGPLASLSVMPDASLLAAIRAVGYLVFLMLVIEVGTQPERTHTLGLILMLGILLHAVFGLVALRLLGDYSIWGEKTVYLGMLTGTFVNRNSIATFLGFGLVLALAYALERGHRAANAERDRGYTAIFTPARLEIIGLWLAVAVLAIAILLTQSRMGVAATVLGAFVTFLALRITFRVPLRRILIEVGIGLVAMLVVLVPAVGDGVLERALFTFVESTDRVSLYVQTWGMILERPLIGFGYDAFAPAFELYRDEPLVNQNFADLAHNTYLTLWVEQGFIIGSIPMLLIGWSAVMILQRLRAAEGDMAVNGAALGVIVLGAMHSLVDFSLEIPANVYCFLLIVGLAIARPRKVQTASPDGEGA
ncbi:O-antigen ligase family protein [Pseudotabrizicola algicola]|uniref:O-antigen ligase family protein n=1 Tax=Pseudotabrizicola algicola TaxID=2709381 RepID=A0A6B3RKB2_9RHOB|nr:O-antigen ligase family protein [Pseudotabrizicola algicola]